MTHKSVSEIKGQGQSNDLVGRAISGLAIPSLAALQQDERQMLVIPAPPNERDQTQNKDQKAKIDELASRNWIDARVPPVFVPLDNAANKMVNRFLLSRDEKSPTVQKNDGNHSMEVTCQGENLVCIVIRNTEPNGTWAQENMILRRKDGGAKWELAVVKKFEDLLCPLKAGTVTGFLGEKGLFENRMSLLLDEKRSEHASFSPAGDVCDVKIARLLNATNGHSFYTAGVDTKVVRIDDTAIRITCNDGDGYRSSYELRQRPGEKGWDVAMVVTAPNGTTKAGILNEEKLDRVLGSVISRGSLQPTHPNGERLRRGN